eukprot:gene11593-biopygen13944
MSCFSCSTHILKSNVARVYKLGMFHDLRGDLNKSCSPGKLVDTSPTLRTFQRHDSALQGRRGAVGGVRDLRAAILPPHTTCATLPPHHTQQTDDPTVMPANVE